LLTGADLDERLTQIREHPIIVVEVDYQVRRLLQVSPAFL